MPPWEGTGEIELLARRVDVLDALADGPARKRDIVEDLDCSRSTLDRAVRELTDAGLVERVPEGYVTTPTGHLASRRYRAFLEEQAAIFGARPVLSTLPADVRPPLSAVVGADVVATDEDDPTETVLSTLRTAERYRAVLPAVADTRHLRLCHARVVREAPSVTLLVGTDLLERIQQEFPAIGDGLARAETVEVATVESPGYGLVLAETDGESSVLVLAFEGEDLTAVLRTDDAETVAWAEQRLAGVRADARPAEDRLRLEAADSPDAAPLTAAAALSDEGFVRVDGDYFARQVPKDPSAAWRTGFDLVDVYYDLALERRGSNPAAAADPQAGPDSHSEGKRPLAAILCDRLELASDQVVVGPPGTGKSTVCRGVACRWVSSNRGEVLYRTAPASGGIDRIGPLVDAIERDGGHTLVVVEDVAADGVAPAVAELLDRYRDAADATVLLEARESEWSELAAAGDRSVRALARGRVSEFRMPGIDEATCRRAIEAFEAATGRSVPLSSDDLHERVRTDSGAGEAYLLAYHLTASTEPLPWTDEGATELDADVAATYDALLDAGEADEGGPNLVEPDSTLPAEVGVLVAVLTAAELSVAPALVHALAVDRADDIEGPPERAHRNVDRVLQWLSGRLVFGEQEDGTLRTRHPYWAVRFLERAVERDEREVRYLFERAVSALFALADDLDGREAIASWLGREPPALERFEDPQAVGELVETVFGLAEKHSGLAPLYSTSDRSGITLPGAAPPETRLSCGASRHKGWYDEGSFDRAVHEAELLCEMARDATDVDPETRARYEGKALRGIGEIAEDRGDVETARERFQESLSVASEAGLPREEVNARNSLGWLATQTDEYERAREHLTTALEIGADLDPCRELATARYYMGHLAWSRGDLAAAEEHLKRTRELDQQLGDRQGESVTLNGLGLVAEDRGAYDRAEEYYRESLSVKRELRVRSEAAKTMGNLGDLLVKRGDLAAAEDYLQRSLSEMRDLGMTRAEGKTLGALGRLERERGNYEAARSRHEQQRSIFEEQDYRRNVATADRDLGDLARERGDLETAAERYEAAFEQFRDLGVPGRAVDLAERLSDLARRRGDWEAAIEWCESGLAVATEQGLDDRAAELRERREELAATAGE